MIRNPTQATPNAQRSALRASALLLALWALVSTIGACTQAGATAFERATNARHLSAALQTQFTLAIDAANRAVMADSDASSAQFAHEAEAAREHVKGSERALSALLRDLDYDDEARLLEEFHGKFAAYEVLDRNILELAVENTNLKAMRLSFGLGQEAADAFQTALAKVASATTGPEAWHVRALTLEASSAVSEIEVIEAPHIAEANDTVMASMEDKMASLLATARTSLANLASLVPPEQLASATAELSRFAKVNAEVIALSRRNSDVRSLDMTLGQKRTIIATCQESLHALAEALTQRVSKPTR